MNTYLDTREKKNMTSSKSFLRLLNLNPGQENTHWWKVGEGKTVITRMHNKPEIKSTSRVSISPSRILSYVNITIYIIEDAHIWKPTWIPNTFLSVWFYTNIFHSSWPRPFGVNFMLMTGQFTHCTKEFRIWYECISTKWT